MRDVIQRLSHLMERENLKQVDLARMTGVSTQAVNNWFKRNKISYESAKIICEQTGYSLDWLLSGDGSINLNTVGRCWIQVVKDRMLDLKITQAKLAEMIEISQPGLAHWLSGRRNAGFAEVSSIMKALKIPQLIINENGETYLPNIAPNSLEVKGEITTASGKPMFVNYHKIIQLANEQPYAIQIKSDDFYPRINFGEYIIIDDRVTPQNGDEVLVMLFDETYMIKRIESYRNGLYRLIGITSGINPITISYDQINEILFIKAILK